MKRNLKRLGIAWLVIVGIGALITFVGGRTKTTPKAYKVTAESCEADASAALPLWMYKATVTNTGKAKATYTLGATFSFNGGEHVGMLGNINGVDAGDGRIVIEPGKSASYAAVNLEQDPAGSPVTCQHQIK
jgi:hypothetical protein